MVSFRRRRLLGLCSGRSCFLAPLLKSLDGTATIGSNQNSKAVAVHPLPMDDDKQLDEKPVTGIGSESSNGSRTSPLTDTQDHPFSEPACKRRKPYRRKHHQNQEPCLMRCVYFKNMTSQASIKVGKKQIHLGTRINTVRLLICSTRGINSRFQLLFPSQGQVLTRYSPIRLACVKHAASVHPEPGSNSRREPNFELAEKEKRQLRKLNWDEFLAVTRHTITNKKQRRITRAGSEKNFEPVMKNGNWDSNEGGNASSSLDYNGHSRNIITPQ